MAEGSRMKKFKQYGFLYRGVREKYIWFRQVVLVTNFAIALQITLSGSVATQCFVAAMCFLVEFVMVSLLWPFTRWWNNLFVIASGAANALQVFLFLYYIQDPTGNSTKYFDALVAVVVISLAGTVVIKTVVWLRGGRKRCLPSDEDVENDRSRTSVSAVSISARGSVSPYAKGGASPSVSRGRGDSANSSGTQPDQDEYDLGEHHVEVEMQEAPTTQPQEESHNNPPPRKR